MQERQSEPRLPAASNSSNNNKEGGAHGRSALSTRALVLRLLGLAFIDAVALWFAYTLYGNGVGVAALILLAITAFVNWMFLSEKWYPIRWLTPGLLMMILMVVYPLTYTVYIALTNYSNGHILTKEQVITQFEDQYYQPANAISFKWTAYRSPDGNFLLLLQDPAGNAFTGTQQDGLKPLTLTGEPPATIDGYTKLDRIQSVQYLSLLQSIQIKSGDFLVHIVSLDQAPESKRKYSYDPNTDKLTDNQTGTTYTPVRGTFTAPDGTELTPGFPVVVGFENFTRVITDPNVNAPFFGVFLWTVIFAAGTVFLTFSVGLGLAIVFNDKHLPLRGFFRSIAIIPYTIPGFISILVWVGLLNPFYGPLNLAIQNITGAPVNWPIDGTLAKVVILFINTWLGFPYMMLLCLGALQSISTDMYEAAEIDGASAWSQFRHLTLPLLLVALAPLLIGTFAFNFNNFSVIDLVNQGGPAIAGSSTPAGQTDILISYTFRLAFSGGKGADYGLASAISLFIFVLIGSITALNFRLTGQLEEVNS
jgi:ABC-type sugar transport system permease subunit